MCDSDVVPVGGGCAQGGLTILTRVTECVGEMFGLDMTEDVALSGLDGWAEATRETAAPCLRHIQLKVLRFGNHS